MINRKKICMVTISPLDYDTRILNEARTLSSFYDLTILIPQYRQARSLKKLPFMVKLIKFFRIYPLSKAMSSMFFLTLATFRQDPDIFHAHDLHGLMCVFWAALFKRKILVYDSHELWSDVTILGFWRILRFPFRVLERLLILKVKYIITVNQSLASFLKKKYHKPTLVCYNYPVLKSSSKKILKSKKLLNKKTLIYMGTFRRGRGLEKIIEAARLLDQNFQILFVGYGKEKTILENKIKKDGLSKKVLILEPVPPAKMIEFIKKAYLGLCLIENVSLSYYYSSPNKLFQYIAAEVPILASDFPEYKKIILKNQIGEVVDPSSPKEIAQKIIEMTDLRNQRRYRQNLVGLAQKKFNWVSEAQKLLIFYQKIEKNLR